MTCLESLFEIIGNVELKNVMKDKSIFIVSNKSNKSDMTFFKFIRSASAVHPSETTNYNKITKHKFEVYPYAIWCDQKEFLGDKKPEGTNIELLSWNCKTNCRYKRYYLKVEEFANFANFLVEYICNLIPYANSIVEDYREKTRLKRIKKIEDFNSYSDYLVYLRNRLEKIKKSDYFADGGLLLASHIMKNPLIGNEFKQLIMKKTEQIVVKLKFDISLINHDEIFEDLILSDVLKNKFNNFSYISEKFHDYLYEETIIEIKDNSFYDFKKTENDGSNADWARSLLLSARGYLYPNGENEKAYSYADLYEITLERIFCLMKEKK